MTITRRSFGKGAVAALGAPLLAGLQQPLSAAAAAPSTGSNAQRAVAAYDAMQRHFYQPQQHLYAGTFPASGNPFSYVWPFSQAYAATVDMAGLPVIGSRYAADVADRATGLQLYWNPAPASHNPPSPPAPPSPPGYASGVMAPLGGGGDLFYDDNEWIGLASIQQYRMTGDAAALTRAQAIFQVVRYGWDPDPSHPFPGGTYWTQAPWSHDRNTISNAPGAELGLHLALLTGDRSAVADSRRMYDWVNGTLLAPNGLYWDHVDLKGTIEKTQWTYNQGVMLGAAALLGQATGDGAYLDRATQLAHQALDFYTAANRLYTQDRIFGAIFFRNLLRLHSVRPDGGYRQAMQSYADRLWEAVDPATGVLAVQPYKPVDLLDQAALVQLYALLAWDPAQYGKIT